MSRRSLGRLVLLALLGAPSLPGVDLPEIKKRGSLRVLVMLDTRRPEFFSTREGKLPGFDHEVLQGFAKLHGLQLEIVPVASWDSLMPALLQKKGDLIAGRFTVTASRRKLIDFTTEVFPTRNVVLNRKPRKPVLTLAELRQEKVGTIKGTSMAEAIAAAAVPPSQVDDGIPAGGFAEALRSGRITAAVWGVESAIAAQREDPDIQLGLFLGPAASLSYGVRKGEAALLQALNEHVLNLRRTPTWSRLVVKYFGDAAPEILKKARPE